VVIDATLMSPDVLVDGDYSMDWDLFFRNFGAAKTVLAYTAYTGVDFHLAIDEVRLMSVTDTLHKHGKHIATLRYSKLYQVSFSSATTAIEYLYF